MLNQEKVLVIDDFLDDPLMTRKIAMSLKYNYGVAWSKNAMIPDSICDELRPKIESVIGSKFVYHKRSKVAQMFHDKPCGMFCHVDGEIIPSFQWSMIVYLNTNEHKLYGDIKSDGNGLHKKDMWNPEAWELIEHIDMKFNRAVFLPSNRFHSAGVPFGDKPENVRLTLNPKLQII